MFTLNKTVARNVKTDLKDTANVKYALVALGYHDDTETGLSPYADDSLFQSVRGFQKDHGLKEDGILRPEGATYKKLKERLSASENAAGAFKDFLGNYFNLRKVNVVDADKYFHCKANYEAAMRGGAGEYTAKRLSDFKEDIDAIRGRMGMNTFTNIDSFRDQGANIYGREAAKSGRFSSSKDACAIYRPEGLNDKY